jgi:hypothetical protein
MGHQSYRDPPELRSGRTQRTTHHTGKLAGEGDYMKEKGAFAAVILVGLGLIVWMAFGTRYYYFDNANGVRFRDDGWTRTRQVWQCEDRPTGTSVVVEVPSASASAPQDRRRVNLPLSASELSSLNKTRQDHHLPQVNGWGRELVRACRWVNG